MHPQMYAYRLPSGFARRLPDNDWKPLAEEIGMMADGGSGREEYAWITSGLWLAFRAFKRLGLPHTLSDVSLGRLPFCNSFIYTVRGAQELFVAAAVPMPWLDHFPSECVEAEA